MGSKLVILLDTHIWVWWINGDSRLPRGCYSYLDGLLIGEIAISVFSCWEVAMLHSRGRLDFGRPLDEWMSLALGRAGVSALELSPEIAVDSCRLPGEFQADPADRIIVATARAHSCPLVTVDDKLLVYPYANVVHPRMLSTEIGE
jgi:PIN domain nuclease of toxin-antitoxin system